MPGKSNPKGGKGHRKNKKPTVQSNTKNMEYREEDEEYAKVTSLLGSGRLRVQLPNKTEKLAIIPGRMKKRSHGNFIVVDDIILVGLRNFQEDKVDVLFRYNPEQVLILQAKKELPDHWMKDTFSPNGDEDVEMDLNEKDSTDDELPVTTTTNQHGVDETGIDFDEI
jgi:translation initiation factor 1A